MLFCRANGSSWPKSWDVKGFHRRLRRPPRNQSEQSCREKRFSSDVRNVRMSLTLEQLASHIPERSAQWMLELCRSSHHWLATLCHVLLKVIIPRTTSPKRTRTVGRCHVGAVSVTKLPSHFALLDCRAAASMGDESRDTVSSYPWVIFSIRNDSSSDEGFTFCVGSGKGLCSNLFRNSDKKWQDHFIQCFILASGYTNGIEAFRSSSSHKHCICPGMCNTNVDGRQKVMFALTAIRGMGRRISNIVPCSKPILWFCCVWSEPDWNCTLLGSKTLNCSCATGLQEVRHWLEQARWRTHHWWSEQDRGSCQQAFGVQDPSMDAEQAARRQGWQDIPEVCQLLGPGSARGNWAESICVIFECLCSVSNRYNLYVIYIYIVFLRVVTQWSSKMNSNIVPE